MSFTACTCEPLAELCDYCQARMEVIRARTMADIEALGSHQAASKELSDRTFLLLHCMKDA